MQHTRAPFAALLLLALNTSLSAEDWPGWRGPRGDGTSQEKIATQWDGTNGHNITWKVPIAGWGHSSPIVWQDRIFVVSCLEEENKRVLVCLDRKTGQQRWQKSVLNAKLERRHSLNSYASGTPVTDGQRVYVTFLEADDFSDANTRTPGNMVVAAYDFDGNALWLVRPGRFASRHGYCSSPILFDDKVIVNGDHDGDSYIVALDRETGKTHWRVKRKHNTRSYVTPLIREINGRTQMVLSGSKSIASYDPHDGSMHWEIDGPTEQFVASMVYDGNLFFLTAGFPTHHVMGIRPGGSGNVTESHVQWHEKSAKCYVPSPVVSGQYLFIADDRGTANCFDTASGKQLWKERLGKHYSASLVTSQGLVYFLADDGVMKVVRPGPELEVVAENPLGENCYASPAIANGQIFLRGEKHLYCISADQP
ncbi:MAG TPA: serine/threonine protein kinase [Planctomycetaceae bacterium]|nr:serine/threonine protein kinase [Planctomycetaceae bacterium]